MPKRAAAALIASMANAKMAKKMSGPRVDSATGWRRRTLRLVDLCMKWDAEHVLCKAMRRWPVAALLEATESWTADMFALVARDWRIKKVARLLEAKGRAFTVECCAEWEPEFLQVFLPETDLVTARHVLAELYFKSDDKHLSPWECRQIVEQYGPKLRRKLLRKFSERDVTRVLRASPADESSDDDSEEEDEEDDSMDGFIVSGGADEDEEDVGDEAEGDDEDDEEEDSDNAGEDEEGDAALRGGAMPMDECEDEDSSDGDDVGEDVDSICWGTCRVPLILDLDGVCDVLNTAEFYLLTLTTWVMVAIRSGPAALFSLAFKLLCCSWNSISGELGVYGALITLFEQRQCHRLRRGFDLMVEVTQNVPVCSLFESLIPRDIADRGTCRKQGRFLFPRNCRFAAPYCWESFRPLGKAVLRGSLTGLIDH
ncbi:hypothetical protein VOLCADRAFT_107548 [Volvox carteri f. nagariensis]|uniref:Uncharacterized protein n=1 Tax=Volvox carteri f. nagariensis TaxID=3068 RepID=D8UES0_VOLCA|nr:uncharacterized protein VOLCADRAFT_107548 [Volvox carteri f. nagariensis]EFJ41821.1 hypothetical protein VOLCADRAFT_107548 [Volvox carteri f. nagariensis]|eukprot:XP_002957167.1 hypothetical protein VOLCADRAFT_107548 [Volvox carteri f. nagariensis]